MRREIGARKPSAPCGPRSDGRRCAPRLRGALTKSRAYSVTLGALRQERADHNEALARERAALAGRPLPDPDTVFVLSHWRFAGTGLTTAESWLATSRRPAAPDTEGDSAWTADETN